MTRRFSKGYKFLVASAIVITSALGINHWKRAQENKIPYAELKKITENVKPHLQLVIEDDVPSEVNLQIAEKDWCRRLLARTESISRESERVNAKYFLLENIRPDISSKVLCSDRFRPQGYHPSLDKLLTTQRRYAISPIINQDYCLAKMSSLAPGSKTQELVYALLCVNMFDIDFSLPSFTNPDTLEVRYCRDLKNTANSFTEDNEINQYISDWANENIRPNLTSAKVCKDLLHKEASGLGYRVSRANQHDYCQSRVVRIKLANFKYEYIDQVYDFVKKHVLPDIKKPNETCGELMLNYER